jgi:hypothetical protein
MNTPPPIPVRAATVPIINPRNGSSISHMHIASISGYRKVKSCFEKVVN